MLERITAGKRSHRQNPTNLLREKHTPKSQRPGGRAARKNKKRLDVAVLALLVGEEAVLGLAIGGKPPQDGTRCLPLQGA